LPPIDVRLTNIKGLAPYRQYVLARDKVRYVGEPVAVVFASDAYTAEDAADLVTIDIEELPAVLDAAGDTGEFAPGLATEVVVIEKGYGDTQTAFKTAPHVVSLTLSVGRHSGVPLETRGAIARYDAKRDML